MLHQKVKLAQKAVQKPEPQKVAQKPVPLLMQVLKPVPQRVKLVQ